MPAKTRNTRPEMTPDHFNARGAGHLPGPVGVTVLCVGPEGVENRLDVRKDLMAPNGFLHAATVVALFRCTQMVLWPALAAG